MTRDEVKAMIALIQMDRPSYLKGVSAEQKTELINLWTEAFGQYDSRVMREAVMNFLRHNPYEPNMAGIQKEIDALINAVDDDTIEYYIEQARLAIAGNRKFEELPLPLQEYFQSQRTIDEYGYEEGFRQGVFVGQLKDRLPDIIARQKAREEMNPEVKRLIEDTFHIDHDRFHQRHIVQNGVEMIERNGSIILRPVEEEKPKEIAEPKREPTEEEKEHIRHLYEKWGNPFKN